MSTVTSPLFHELVDALEAIVRGAPKAKPVVYGSDSTHWHLAEIARAALAKVAAGDSLITVSPPMIEDAQDAFIADWRLGASPDAAITSAVRAAVNHINNSIKERR